MKIIIGLGNPGKEYERNRHNVGHLFVDFFEGQKNTQEVDAKLFKTDRFMNDSGRFVAEKVNFFKIHTSDLFIVHDDLDLKFGEYKIQLGVGPKIHYGINSVEESLQTKDFWRVRIGVDNRQEERRTPGEKYVLENFSEEELVNLQKTFVLASDDLFKLLK